jgi:hypothetical protein
MVNQSELQVRSEYRAFASSIFVYSELRFIVYKNKNLIVSHSINEITIIQYGMSMNFYNKLEDTRTTKVLDYRGPK